MHFHSPNYFLLRCSHFPFQEEIHWTGNVYLSICGWIYSWIMIIYLCLNMMSLFTYHIHLNPHLTTTTWTFEATLDESTNAIQPLLSVFTRLDRFNHWFLRETAMARVRVLPDTDAILQASPYSISASL